MVTSNDHLFKSKLSRRYRRAYARISGNAFVPMPNPTTLHLRDGGVVKLGFEYDGSSKQRSDYMQRMHRIGKTVPWPSESVLTPV